MLMSRFLFVTNLLLFRICGATRTLSTRDVLMALQATDFEVFGRVQGVFFRKFTKDQADKLGLKGWCKNTDHGSVLGHIEGPQDQVSSMIHWLKTTGSPSSQIDRAEIKNQKTITGYQFPSFDIKK